MSYRKFFLLIAFAPFALLLLAGDARAQCFLDPDGCGDPWGFWGGGGGSTIGCRIAFGDATMSGLNGGTVKIQGVQDLSCTHDGQPVQGQIVSPPGIVISGVQAGQCVTNKADKTSTQRFSANCGSGNVEGDIVLGVPLPNTWSFAVDLNSTGACNNSNLFPPVPDPNNPKTLIFAKNEIFATTVSFNNTNCSGLGNDGQASFRSCTGSALGTDPHCIANNPALTATTSAIQPDGSTQPGGLDQISTFGLSCQRLPTNQTSCPNSNGIITATLHLNDASNISSVKCGNPDNPFLSNPRNVTVSGNDLNVTCFRCDQVTGDFVPGPDGELVVTANQKESSTAKFSHIVGGSCDVLPTSGNP